VDLQSACGNIPNADPAIFGPARPDFDLDNVGVLSVPPAWLVYCRLDLTRRIPFQH
jgi:hypothetical protein